MTTHMFLTNKAPSLSKQAQTGKRIPIHYYEEVDPATYVVEDPDAILGEIADDRDFGGKYIMAANMKVHELPNIRPILRYLDQTNIPLVREGDRIFIVRIWD